MTQAELNKDNKLQAQWTRTPAGNIVYKTFGNQ